MSFGHSIHTDALYAKAVQPAWLADPLTTTGALHAVSDLDAQIRAAQAAGATIMRIMIPFEAIAPIEAGASQADWEGWTDGGTLGSHLKWTTGAINWDTVVQKFRSAGLDICFILGYGTRWLKPFARKGPSQSFNVDAYWPTGPTDTHWVRMLKAFEQYSYELANRYKVTGKTTYYSIWNEPSLVSEYKNNQWAYGFWDVSFDANQDGTQDTNGSIDAFRQLLAYAAYRVHQADSNAQVMFDVHQPDHLGPLSVNKTQVNQFGQRMFDWYTGFAYTVNGVNNVRVIDYVDIIATHAYPDRVLLLPENQRLDGQNNWAPVTRYLSTMDQWLKAVYSVGGPQNGVSSANGRNGSATRGHKRFWCNEFGWYAARPGIYSGEPGGGWVTEEKQAALLVRMMTLLSTLAQAQSGGNILDVVMPYELIQSGWTVDDTSEYKEASYGIFEYQKGAAGVDNLDAAGNHKPRPAVTALNLFQQQLRHANFVAAHPDAPTGSNYRGFVYRYVNTQTNRRVWIAWLAVTDAGNLNVCNTTYDKGIEAQTASYTLGVESPSVSVMALDGTETFPAVSGTGPYTVTLTLSEKPLIIIERLTGDCLAFGNGLYGSLGNGTTAGSKTPVRVSSLTNLQKVVHWNDTVLGLLANSGMVYTWGGGKPVGLQGTVVPNGDQSVIAVNRIPLLLTYDPAAVGASPAQDFSNRLGVVPLSNIVDLAAGGISPGYGVSALFVRDDGRLFFIGADDNVSQRQSGAIWYDSRKPSAIPILSAANTPVTDAGGGSTGNIQSRVAVLTGVGAYITTGNKVKTWGLNTGGALGQNNPSGSAVVKYPATVKKESDGTDLTNVIKIVSDHDRAFYALCSDGTLWTWGRSYSGYRGIGDTNDHHGAVQCKKDASTPITDAIDVAAMPWQKTVVAILNAGGSKHLYIVGDVSDGKHGQGGSSDPSPPTYQYFTRIGSITGAVLVAAGTPYHLAYLDGSGNVYFWGRQATGEFGNGVTLQTLHTPTQVSMAALRTICLLHYGSMALTTPTIPTRTVLPQTGAAGTQITL